MNQDPGADQPTNQPPDEPSLDRSDEIQDPALASIDQEPASQPSPEPVGNYNENLARQAQQEAPASVAVAPAPVQAPKRSRKPLVAGVIAAALVLVVGGGAAAYNLWYQDPQKVVTDAFVNMIKAETATMDGTMNIEPQGEYAAFEKMTLKLDSQSEQNAGYINAELSIDAEGNTLSLSGSAQVDGDANIYLKLNDARKMLDEVVAMADEGEGMTTEDVFPASVLDLVTKIDGSWVRIGAEDYQELDQTAREQQECLANVVKKLETDNAVQQQVADAYRDNQFIVIKEELGVVDGNIGYVLDGDREKAVAFAERLQETDIYKDLRDCDDSFEINPEDLDVSDVASDVEGRVEVWVSRFGHELQQVKFSATDDDVDMSMDMNTRFNQPVDVTAPTEYIPLKELISDMEAIWIEMMGGFAGPTSGSLDVDYIDGPDEV